MEQNEEFENLTKTKYAKPILISIVVIMIIWNALEFLAIPALLVIIGILNDFPPIYYIVSIGCYLALFALLELILFVIEKVFGKRMEMFIGSKIEKIISAFKQH